MQTTIDKLLNGKIEVEQPAKGFRIAIDTILLAAAVPAQTGQSVLELGCGVGGAMLALARRVPDIHVTGIEIQSELADLCRTNILRNGVGDRLTVISGDISNLPPAFFNHVMMNPPYHEADRHDASANPSKRTANTESAADLAVWIAAAASALKDGGALAIIHKASRVDEIIALATKEGLGAARIKPLCPKKDAPPKRVIIRAVKGAALTPALTDAPIILHEADGRYTPEADFILREAQGI